ncbi:MAG TPA: ubiquinol-cytochrome c reductase iron-sulfur subunit [Pirellulales bacterium]|jgi:Rieske Fe-S protein|nr:ubiquinol-cytochrome c reductase iron-sulfur subunit [Pirellulales bacterium]
MTQPHTDPVVSASQAPVPCNGAAPPRRSFFFWFTALAGTVAGLLAGVPIVGYFVSPRQKQIKWVTLGPLKSFTIGETRMAVFDNPLRQPWDGVVAQTGVYVRRESPGEDGAAKFLVFAINCAHLGCPVSWFPQSGLFMCPCHGGVYYADGNRASGPPPRGLFHCVWRVSEDHLEIQAPHYPTLQDTLTEKPTDSEEA